MGDYLNPGNGNFKQALNTKTYVDKSGLIRYTNGVLNTLDKYLCVSRPRRFGKTVTANMLTAYYSRGCDSRALFDGTEVSKSPDYETHINKYDVIYLDAARFFSENHQEEGLTISQSLNKFVELLTDGLTEEYPDILRGKEPFTDYLLNVSTSESTSFVFVIDEWDSVFRENKDDKEEQDNYLKFLRNLLKDREYVALAYMTGILPIKKYGTHSALNMFKEISMTDADPIQKYMGFTEEEVKVLCRGDKEKEAGIKEWFNGYTVNGLRIYNPYAVREAVVSSEPLHGYWTATETYEALEVYIRTNAYGVQDRLVDLLAGKPVEVKTDKFTNDMVTFTGCDDVLTLLIHLGYLTMSYDDEKKKKYVSIPNKEVREQFLISMEACGLGNPENVIMTSQAVLDATLKGDAKTVAENVEIIHQERTSVQDYNEEISLKYVIQFAYVAAEKHYSMVREMPAGKGYADMAFIPLEKTPAYPPMVIELKVRGPKSGAMNQIKKKQYERFLKGYEGDVVLVGIHYNRRTKEHSCQIKRIPV